MHGLSAGLFREKIKRSVFFGLTAVAVIIGDQLSKVWVLDVLAPRPDHSLPTIDIIPRILRFQYAENTGAAFSMFQEHPGALTLVASLLAFGVFVWSFLLPVKERLSRVSLGLIFGGAVGNLVDRAQHGFVIDFVQFHWDGRPMFPTFNVADSAICIGIGVFFIASWLAMRAEDKAKAAAMAGAHSVEK